MFSRRKNVNSQFYVLPEEYYDNNEKHIDNEHLASFENTSNDISISNTFDNRTSFNTKDGEHIIDFKQIRQYLQLFKPYGLQPIIDLPADLQSMFKSFSNFMNKVQENTQIYKRVRELIVELYPYENTIIIPSTVNAYFIGCQCSTFKSEQGCDPECVNNLPAIIDGKVLTNACSDYVLVYTNNELMSLHEGNKRSNVAWIYVDQYFNKFDHKSILQLQKYKIATINLLRADEKGKYVKIEEKLPLNNFIATKDLNTRDLDSDNTNTTNQNGVNVTLAWILLVVCLVIILAFICFVFYRNYQYKHYNNMQNVNYTY
jgi:hypothetical protein